MRFSVEVRYPFLDLRIVNFLLGVPPFPWLYKKTLLRKTMDARLPKITRVRAKTPLPVHPLVEFLKRPDAATLDRAYMPGDIDRYVDRERLDPLAGQKDTEKAYLMIRPLCLNFWLQSVRQVRYNLNTEVR